MIRRSFGELELGILNILRSGQRMTVREVQLALGKGDSYTTIMTVMGRLFEKGELEREKISNHFEYWTKGKTSSLLERLKKKIFGGNSKAMISYLIESSEDITKEELKELEKLIAKAKRK